MRGTARAPRQLQARFEAIRTTASWAGKPVAFLTAFGTVLLLGITGLLFHQSDSWQLVINTVARRRTTIVMFLMVFLMQNTHNRDTLALQVKLGTHCSA
jgi:low affinity Fe/Cu permease